MLLLGIIVTGTHQARRTGNASADGSPNKVSSAVQAAVKALVAFPLLVRWNCCWAVSCWQHFAAVSIWHNTRNGRMLMAQCA